MLKTILAAAGLAAALSWSSAGCASQQNKNQQMVCKEQVTTGSHIARPICRPVDKNEIKRQEQQEAHRRAQQRDQMRNPDNRPQK